MQLEKELLRYRRQLGSGRRKPNKMDRIRSHYLEGNKLKPTDEAMRVKYEKAHALLCEGNSREDCVRILVDLLNINRSQCYNILRDATELFGDITKSNKEGKRYIISEHLLDIAKKARDKDDYDNWLRALETYAKINGLYDFTTSFDPNKVQMPQQIVFMTDPKILIQNQTPSDE